MKKYNNFKEYMEDVYYDEIFNKGGVINWPYPKYRNYIIQYWDTC